MSQGFILATNSVTRADLTTARLGQRFGRMDLACQLSLLAVEPFAPMLERFSRDRIAISLAVRAGSLPTDLLYWEGRDQPGGLSPTLFTYTLPSAIIGELAIRHRITGPNLCFVGGSELVLPEAAEWLRTGEADAVVGVYANVVSAALTALIPGAEVATASAVLLNASGPGPAWSGENHRDMESLCVTLRPHNLTK